MTMKALTEPTAVSARQQTAVVLSALLSGQRAKHESELRRLGFEVDTRDFPKSYNFDAYDVIFIVREHADTNAGNLAERAATASGKPWFRLTKKTSHATWESVRAYARRLGLTPIGDSDTHPPSLSGKGFATAFAEALEKKSEDIEWEDLAKEYEAAAQAANAKYEVAEAEVRELRKRLADAEGAGSSTAAQREAIRRELALAKGEAERLTKEVAALRDANRAILTDRDDAVRARSQLKRDYERAIDERNQQSATVRRLQEELKTAREELQELREEKPDVDEDYELEIDELKKKLHSKENMLTLARKERDDAKAAVVGLQDEVDRLGREAAAERMKRAFPSAPTTVPAGKRLVPANIVATVERLWALVGDGVLEADEAMEKILAQLKGD